MQSVQSGEGLVVAGLGTGDGLGLKGRGHSGFAGQGFGCGHLNGVNMPTARRFGPEGSSGDGRNRHVFPRGSRATSKAKRGMGAAGAKKQGSKPDLRAGE